MQHVTSSTVIERLPGGFGKHCVHMLLCAVGKSHPDNQLTAGEAHPVVTCWELCGCYCWWQSNRGGQMRVMSCTNHVILITNSITNVSYSIVSKCFLGIRNL